MPTAPLAGLRWAVPRSTETKVCLLPLSVGLACSLYGSAMAVPVHLGLCLCPWSSPMEMLFICSCLSASWIQAFSLSVFLVFTGFLRQPLILTCYPCFHALQQASLRALAVGLAHLIQTKHTQTWPRDLCSTWRNPWTHLGRIHIVEHNYRCAVIIQDQSPEIFDSVWQRMLGDYKRRWLLIALQTQTRKTRLYSAQHRESYFVHMEIDVWHKTLDVFSDCWILSSLSTPRWTTYKLFCEIIMK